MTVTVNSVKSGLKMLELLAAVDKKYDLSDCDPCYITRGNDKIPYTALALYLRHEIKNKTYAVVGYNVLESIELFSIADFNTKFIDRVRMYKGSKYKEAQEEVKKYGHYSNLAGYKYLGRITFENEVFYVSLNYNKFYRLPESAWI